METISGKQPEENNPGKPGKREATGAKTRGGAVKNLPCSMRPVIYMHRDDPILIDAIAGFDGVFLNPIPAPIARILRKPEHPVVVLDEDFSRYGLPSIQFFPPVFIQCPLSCSFEAGSVETITLPGLPFPRAVQPRNRQQIP